MKSWIRNCLVALALAALVGGSASQVALAQAAPAAQGREAHPLLRRALRQLEAVKDEMQKAPDDFHGHKAAAIDAVTHAINELQQAIASDKK
jgi:hypothetical protein